MEKVSGHGITSLKADGGAIASKFLMQFQSNILSCTVACNSCAETTALGAAFMAGLACGFYKGLDDLPKMSQGAVYSSELDEQSRERLLQGWKKAVRRVLGWEDK